MLRYIVIDANLQSPVGLFARHVECSRGTCHVERSRDTYLPTSLRNDLPAPGEVGIN